jgi:hypothetical protein
VVRLYPARFRRHYGDDLAQVFSDMVERDGPARAWGRTIIDVLVTLPRYRLEAVMNPWQSSLALFLTIAGLITIGVVSILIGLYPGALLLLAGVILGVAQRSQLARSMRAPDARRRRHLLVTAAVLSATCAVGATAMYFDLRDDEHWPGGKLALYNVFFFATVFGALGCLAAGIRSPRPGAGGGRVISA